MSFVDDEQRAEFFGQLAQRLVVAGFGMHDADVGHDRLGQHAGHVAGSQRLLECRDIIELDHLGGDGWIDRRTDVAAARLRHAVFQRDETFVHRAVIAPVENQNLGTLA